jgi:hypothetical protein
MTGRQRQPLAIKAANLHMTVILSRFWLVLRSKALAIRPKAICSETV